MMLIQDGSQGPTTPPTKQVAVGTPGYAYGGPPGSTPSSRWGADVANTILAELIAIATAAGDALDPTDNAQCLAALKKIFGQLATANTWAQTQTLSAGAVSTGADSGGANFRAVSGSYGAIFRVDGSNAYWLQTASGTPNGSFNAFRPFSWSFSTGAVSIDGTGEGVDFGGDITVAGRVISTGTSNPHAGILSGAAQVSNPIANQTNGLQSLANGSTQIYTSSASPLSIGQGTLGTALGFFWGNTQMGSVSTANGASVTYNTTSDYRIKNITGAADGTPLSSLPVHFGTFTTVPNPVPQPMFLAHELAAVAPYAVTGEKDAVDGEGKPVLQQVDHSALVPLLLAYTQSLEKRIAAQDERIAALEAASTRSA